MKHILSTRFFIFLFLLSQAVSGHAEHYESTTAYHSAAENVQSLQQDCPDPFIVGFRLKNHIECGDEVTTPNGEAEAYVLIDDQEVTEGYVFNWYIGTEVKESPDFTGTTYRGLEAGTYSVEAIHEESGCVADLQQLNIGAEDYPYEVQVELVSANTGCEEEAYTGTLRASVVDADGNEYTGGDFTFTWYPAAVAGEAEHIIGTGATIEGLAGGEYTVIMTDNITACTSRATITVPDETVQPILAVASTLHITQCAEAEGGAIEVSLDGEAGDYTIHWFKGEETAEENRIADEEGMSLVGYPAGTYTVQAINNNTLCISNTETVVIQDQTASPEVAGVVASNTACNAEMANGSIELSINTPSPGTEPADGYQIQWFYGTGTEGTALEATGTTVDGLTAGNYTAVVTNPESGCFSQQTFTLADELLIPGLSLVSVEPNTVCDPERAAGGAYTGAINLELRNDGNIVEDPADYTISWYVLEGEVETLLEENKALSREGLPGGRYKVVATHELSGCSSDEIIIDIEDATVIPVVEISSTNITSCDAPNGTVSAATAEEITGNIIFEWYSGTQTDAANLIATVGNGEELNGLEAGAYTVVATDRQSGCASAPETVTLSDETSLPVVEVAGVQHVSSCDTSNGSAEAYVLADDQELTEGYTFNWYAGSEAKETPDYTGASVTGLSEGTYSVEAIHNASGCVSELRQFTIEEEEYPYEVQAMLVSANTGCESEAYNGALRASVVDADGNEYTEGDFTFTWYPAAVAGEAEHIIGTGATIEGLAGGEYTVTMTDNITACTSTATITVPDETVQPQLSLQVSQQITQCDNPDAGEIQASLDVAGDYSLRWYRGEAVTEENRIVAEEGMSLSGYPAGIYTAQAIHNATLCVSTIETVEIEDLTASPEVEATLTNNSACDTELADGSIILNISTPLPGAAPEGGYQVEWYQGSSTAGTPLDITGIMLENLTAGSYTAVVTNPESGCSSQHTFTVEDTTQTPVIEAVDIRPLTHCDAPNGEIEIALEGDGEAGEYLIEWYQGNETDAAQHLEDLSDQYLVSGLAAGTYTVQSTHIATGCQSAPLTLTIEDATVAPEVTVVSTPLTNCNPNRPDGAFSFSVDGETSGYSFVLYRGSEADEASLVGEGPEIGGLREGEYLLITTNENTNCVSSEIISIETGTTFPEAPVTVGAESCEAAELTLRVEGNGTYYWYDQPTGGNAFHAGNSLFRNFNQTATYYVATVNDDGCESRERSAVSAVIHELAEPVIEANDDVLSTTLDDAFTYQWYLDGELLAETEHTITAEASGIYEVEVTNEAGCSRRSAPYAFTVSAVIDTEYDAAIRVYPNPFQDRLHISLAREAGTTSIRIMDGQMRQLRSLTITGHEEGTVLDLSGLPQGMYYVEIREGERVTYKRIARQ